MALLVGATLMILFVVTDLARELSQHSFQGSPDLDSCDDWDRMRSDEVAGRANALDDLHSTL
jgi:hypothetical protein